MGLAKQEELNQSKLDFPTQLAQALIAWAEQHPHPETQIEFIGSNGRMSFTPMELAQEVKNQTPFGLNRIEFYKGISSNLGDESGARVIQDLLNFWETQE